MSRMEIPEEAEMITANEAAKRKGVTRQAVGQAIKDGRLKAKKWGRFYMIRPGDLDDWEVVGHRPRNPTKESGT